MNAVSYLVAAVQYGVGARRGPLPVLDSPELWRTVVDLAIDHRVAPLLHQALSQAPESAAPASVREALYAQLLRSSATRLLCETTLADIVPILRNRGVELIVLKGPTVAHTVYERPELRLYHDLDVLCRVADYATLHQVLSERGYTSAGTLEARGAHDKLAGKPSPRESHSVRGFYDPSGDVKIEVHFDALQLGLRDRHEQEFWRESLTLELDGATIRMLSAEHQFLHLAAHAHRHGYSRLSWLIELDVLARQTRGSLNWHRLMKLAADEGVGVPLRHALSTLNAVLGTPLPSLPSPSLEERCLGAVYQLLWPHDKVRSLNQHEHHRLLHFLPDDADVRNVLYGLVLVGRRRDKLHALWRRRWPLGRQSAAE
jgi:hypothetical protein